MEIYFVVLHFSTSFDPRAVLAQFDEVQKYSLLDESRRKRATNSSEEENLLLSFSYHLIIMITRFVVPQIFFFLLFSMSLKRETMREAFHRISSFYSYLIQLHNHSCLNTSNLHSMINLNGILSLNLLAIFREER